MKKVFRTEDNRSYWDRRWREASEDADTFLDDTIYPIRYAESVVASSPGRIVEIGCGLGRLVKHYDACGRDIVGIERSRIAVERIKARSPKLDVRVGDAMALDFADGTFDIALAFGLYHNFETGLDKGLSELSRVLKPGGKFVVSMRPDNVEMTLNEWYWRFKSKAPRGAPRKFHKLLVTEREFEAALGSVGLTTLAVHRARNMSILFRLGFLRDREADSAPESVRRSKGYRLNRVGAALDGLLTAWFPAQFCNVLVFEGYKSSA